jgi:hypothetical protein
MPKPKSTYCTGPGSEKYEYLGHFAKNKYLAQGHNDVDPDKANQLAQGLNSMGADTISQQIKAGKQANQGFGSIAGKSYPTPSPQANSSKKTIISGPGY